jgi:hypothetical protein
MKKTGLAWVAALAAGLPMAPAWAVDNGPRPQS